MSHIESMPKNTFTYIVCHEDLWPRVTESLTDKREKGKYRLDHFLMAQEALSSSRSQIRKWILEGAVTVNGKTMKPGYRLKESDYIACSPPAPRPMDLAAEDLPLEILFEDEHLIVLNKAAGMVVHPGPGHYTGTLVHALLNHCRHLSGIGGVQRPGIIHRLDRETSGVMLVAKTDPAHQHLSQQLKSRDVSRIYAALVHGTMKSLAGRVDAPLGRHRNDRKKMAVEPEKGRFALSLYRVVEQYAQYALLDVELKTGRTHQIRVHMKHIHHPVVGDPVYGLRSKNNLGMPRQALHARAIRFIHPVSGQEMTFETSLPNDMQQLVEKLRLEAKG